MLKIFFLSVFLASALALPSRKPNFSESRSKIVGGQETTPGQFPYVVTLQDGSFSFYYHICGGSIYTESYVLTAATCVYNEDIDNPYYLAIIAGEQTLDVSEGNEQLITLDSITIHEDYNSYSKSNDIALLKLSTSLVYDAYVQPIYIPVSGQQSTGTCNLSGWGSNEKDGTTSSVLQYVALPIVSDTDCRTSYGEHDVEDSMICAGETGKGGCQGDTGSPLACQDSSGKTYLAGIGSWSYQCGTDGYPSVFAEVSYFANWILANAV